LRRGLTTPQDLFFVRNHGTVPAIDPDRYRLSVGGSVRQTLSLSLDEIRDRFPKRTVPATLLCAGYRRRELLSVAPIPDEIPWGGEAIGNASWSGASLRDVLRAAGGDPTARHAAFTGLDEIEVEEGSTEFGGSIPIEKAKAPEVLLAYEMNGEPLSPLHGFPLRLVVPGYVGARSVKWLSTITLQAHPSTNYFQKNAYRLARTDDPSGALEEDGRAPLGAFPVNAFICTPREGESVVASPVQVEGYALTGGGGTVESVELSADGGRRWMTAELLGKPRPWVWRFWQAAVDLPPGACRLVARAVDSRSRTQPENARTIWNPKGYLNNAWHRVDFRLAR